LQNSERRIRATRSNTADRLRHRLAIIAVVQGIGPQLGTKFTAVNSSLK